MERKSRFRSKSKGVYSIIFVLKYIIAIAENPIYCLSFLVEYHLNVRERYRHCVKALIMLVIFLVVHGVVVVQNLVNDNPLFLTEFLCDFLLVLYGVFKRVAVAKRDKAAYSVYRLAATRPPRCILIKLSSNSSWNSAKVFRVLSTLPSAK